MGRMDKINAQYQENSAKFQEIAAKTLTECERVSNIACRAGEIYAELDRDFQNRTGLNSTDMAFLFFATALQCTRQFIIGSLTVRGTDKESAETTHRIQKTIFGKEREYKDGVRYKASLDEILYNTGVPYDTVSGSKFFKLGNAGKGFSGDSHRFHTLGHDPLLGWIFGTANIMTRTLTTETAATYHVKRLPNARGARIPTIANHASTAIMFQKVYERSVQEPQALAAAVIKQGLHFTSDMYSTNGLSIPGIMVLSSETAQQLATFGDKNVGIHFDTGTLLKAGAQFGVAELIHEVIALIHGLYFNPAGGLTQELYQVKTKKILAYSDVIASSANIAGTTLATALGSVCAINYLDLGGIAASIRRIFASKEYIEKIKLEFISDQWSKTVLGEI